MNKAMNDFLLAFDVGNTNIKIGVYEGEALRHVWRVATQRDMTSHELWEVVGRLLQRSGIDSRQFDGIVISSVVPPLMTAIREVGERYFGKSPLVAGPGAKTGLTIHTDQPAQTGADRIVSAMAAVERYGAPVIVLCLGTATTISVVDDRKRFLGGTIAPGGMISADALLEQTAVLPSVDFTDVPKGIGLSTEDSMKYGILVGLAGQIDGIVSRMKEEMGLPFTVVASGGISRLISPYSKTVQHTHPDLVLEGLPLLWRLNR